MYKKTETNSTLMLLIKNFDQAKWIVDYRARYVQNRCQ